MRLRTWLRRDRPDSRGVLERGGRRLDPLFGCEFQGSVQCNLNLARRFLARFSVRHNAGPFDDLGNETFVAFLRRIQMRIS